MTFTVGNAAIDFTSMQGEIIATRAELVAVFGEPNYTGDMFAKVQTEWDLTFTDGTVATIYDWKRYEDGPAGLREAYSWHIGGHTASAVDRVLGALRGTPG